MGRANPYGVLGLGLGSGLGLGLGRIPTACQRALQSDGARAMDEQCEHCKNLEVEAAAPLLTGDFFTARHMLPLGFRQRFG